MIRPRLGLVVAATSLAGWLGAGAVATPRTSAQPAAAQPRGELTYAMHVTVAPAWFDPADMYIPLYALSFHNGVGPRVAESSLGRIPLHCYTAPFEDMRLRGD